MDDTVRSWTRYVTPLLLLAVFGAAAAFGYGWSLLPAVPTTRPAPDHQPDWPEPAARTGLDGSIVRPAPESAAPVRSGPLANRYRLAGTFFSFGGNAGAPGEDRRTAVVDDLQSKEQFLAREGESLGEWQVVRIYPERMVLRNQGLDEELWLSFSQPGSESAAGGRPAKVAPEELPPLETNPFGKRVGETRWVFGRQPLMDYYNELMEDPERLASLFLSMKPDYQGSAIAGYRLDIEGEERFFKDVGMKPGDVVRKVNSMAMVSQSRAEFFIREFVKGNLGAVVLDIERQGQPEKLVYLIR